MFFVFILNKRLAGLLYVKETKRIFSWLGTDVYPLRVQILKKMLSFISPKKFPGLVMMPLIRKWRFFSFLKGCGMTTRKIQTCVVLLERVGVDFEKALRV